MDPISALSLASNVIQFVDFATKVVAAGLDIYKSTNGTTQENADREQSVARLMSFTESLTSMNARHGRPDLRQSPSVPHELAVKYRELSAPHVAAIQAIASDCGELCDEIITLGNDLKVRKDTSHRVLKTVAVIAKGLSKAKELKSLEERLKTMEGHLRLCFLQLLNEHQQYTVAIAEHISRQSDSLADGTTPGFQIINKKLATLDEKIRRLGLPAQARPWKLKHKAKALHDPAGSTPSYVQDISNITDDFDMLGADLALLERQQSFIKSLHFDGQDYRHESIPEAHRMTFEWVFPEDCNKNTEKHPMSKVLRQKADTGHQRSPPLREVLHHISRKDTNRNYLSQWLKYGSGIFWVSGRPGSGKSTLMKFIADHSKTFEALIEWAGGKGLAIAAHYFWISGTPMQRSLKGMLLQLLFDIVRKEPRLVQDIFASRFNRWNSGQAAEVTATRGEDKWTIRELTEALEILARDTQMSIRVCVFIDGLDEYDGDHHELCKMLKSFELSTCVKLCVSSRPWNVFQDAFGTDPTKVVHVHELTYDDIKAFAEDHLQNFGDFDTLRLTTTDIMEMGNYITSTAKGVFLWVFLVTKTLRDGIVDGDTVVDLWTRLKDFPDELDPFYNRILHKVDRAHQKYMAEGLKIFLLEAEQTISRNRWYLTSYALARLNAPPPTESDVYACLNITDIQAQRRINARFGGLLTTNEDNDDVTVIHRTASDFLLSGQTQEYLDGIAPDFKPKLGLLKGVLCYLRWIFLNSNYAEIGLLFPRTIKDIYTLSDLAISEDPDETTRLLDLYRVMAQEPAFCASEKKLDLVRWGLDNKNILYADDGNGVEVIEPIIDPTLDLARLFPSTYLDRKEAEGTDMSHVRRVSRVATLTIREIMEPVYKIQLDAYHSLDRRLLVHAQQPFPTLWHIVLLAKCATIAETRGHVQILRVMLSEGASRVFELWCPEGLGRFGCTISWNGSCLPLRCAISWQLGSRRSQNIRRILKDLIDLFLLTGDEENRVQLADAMYYADASLHTPAGVEIMLSDTTVFEYVLKKAIEKALPASSFEPLMKNRQLLDKLTPKIKTRLTKYLTSPGVVSVIERDAEV